MKKIWDHRSLIHAVRIAATMANEQREERNPAYVQALEIMAGALEDAKVSVRRDGDYLMVKIPCKMAVVDSIRNRSAGYSAY